MPCLIGTNDKRCERTRTAPDETLSKSRWTMMGVWWRTSPPKLERQCWVARAATRDAAHNSTRSLFPSHISTILAILLLLPRLSNAVSIHLPSFQHLHRVYRLCYRYRRFCIRCIQTQGQQDIPQLLLRSHWSLPRSVRGCSLFPDYSFIEVFSHLRSWIGVATIIADFFVVVDDLPEVSNIYTHSSLATALCLMRSPQRSLSRNLRDVE